MSDVLENIPIVDLGVVVLVFDDVSVEAYVVVDEYLSTIPVSG